MYTDDTTLFTTIQSFNNHELNESIEEQLNKEIYKITQWLDINKLPLNVAKSAYIIHKHANKQLIPIQLKINDKPIQKVHKFNFFGLTLNENLNSKDHIDSTANKWSKTITIFNFNISYQLINYTITII